METFVNRLQQSINEGVLSSSAILAKRKDGTTIISKYLDRQPTPWSSRGAINEESIFTLASCTKLPTTIAALHVVERGLINLDDDVTSKLPALGRQQILTGWNSDGSPILQNRKNPITLRQLLTHSAGVAYAFQSEDLTKFHQWRGTAPSQGFTVEERFNLPLLYEPGEGWAYSCGLDWAGKLVEQLSGMSLGAYLDQHVWGPLGVASFTFFPQSRQSGDYHIVTPTKRNESTGNLEELPRGLEFNVGLKECFGGQGGYRTAGDYLKLISSILANDGRILQKETVDNMFEPQLSPQSKEALQQAMKDPSWAVGDFYPGEEYDWGLGGLLVDGGHKTDAPYSRGPRTLIWSGAANLFWFIDRSNSLCGLFVTQVLPSADPEVEKLITAFQEYVYSSND